MCDDNYVREVEEFFLGLAGQGVALPESDIRVILKWKAMGVPVQVLQKAIRREVERLVRSGMDEPPVRLRLYRGAVDKAIQQWSRSGDAGLGNNVKPQQDAPDLPDRLRQRVARAKKQYQGPLLRALQGLKDENDPEVINRAILEAVMGVMEPDTKDGIEEAAKQAEARALRAGMGRMAAQNLGIRVLRQMVCKEVGLNDLFA